MNARVRTIAGVLIAALSLIGGCAHRERLDHARFEQRVRVSDDNLSRIRVYPSRRIIVEYHMIEDRGTRVDSDIHVRDRRLRLRLIAGRSARGKIVAVDSEPGRTMLWIAFERACHERGCAFGFAQVDDQRFRLTSVPPRRGLPAHAVSAGDRGVVRTLRWGRVVHRGEAYPVYRTWRRRGRLVVIELDVREHRRRGRFEREVIRGVDREAGTGDPP